MLFLTYIAKIFLAFWLLRVVEEKTLDGFAAYIKFLIAQVIMHTLNKNNATVLIVYFSAYEAEKNKAEQHSFHENTITGRQQHIICSLNMEI